MCFDLRGNWTPISKETLPISWLLVLIFRFKVCNECFKIKRKKNHSYNYPCAFCNSQQIYLVQKKNPPLKKRPIKEKLNVFFKFQQTICFYFTHQNNIMPSCFSIGWWHLQKENCQLCIIVMHKIKCTYPNGTQGGSSTYFSWTYHHRNVEFIFHIPKYLNTCNFYKFYEFQAFMFEDGNKVELSPTIKW